MVIMMTTTNAKIMQYWQIDDIGKCGWMVTSGFHLSALWLTGLIVALCQAFFSHATLLRRPCRSATSTKKKRSSILRMRAGWVPGAWSKTQEGRGEQHLVGMVCACPGSAHMIIIRKKANAVMCFRDYNQYCVGMVVGFKFRIYVMALGIGAIFPSTITFQVKWVPHYRLFLIHITYTYTLHTVYTINLKPSLWNQSSW